MDPTVLKLVVTELATAMFYARAYATTFHDQDEDFWDAKGWDIEHYPDAITYEVDPFEVQMWRGNPSTVYRRGRAIATMTPEGRWTRARDCTDENWRVISAAAVIASKSKPPRASTAAYPRKINSMRRAPAWSGDAYSDICAHMRGKRNTTQHQGVLTALKAYMKHSAPIAPSVPRGATRIPTVLWRGVKRMRPPSPGETVSSNAGCFTAFSHDRTVALRFGISGFVFRLQVNRIARGTPWAWFSPTATATTRRADALKAWMGDEGEVLLPPGYFKVLGVSRDKLGHTVVDVAFVPSPEYVRRGAMPSLNASGRAVTRTTRGNAIVMQSSNLAAKIRARRDLIAKSASRMIARRR